MQMAAQANFLAEDEAILAELKSPRARYMCTCFDFCTATIPSGQKQQRQANHERFQWSAGIVHS